jgi:mono/diheme cytochrome c family protein
LTWVKTLVRDPHKVQKSIALIGASNRSWSTEMKRRNLTAAAIAFGACLMIVDVATPSARLCAAEPQSFSEDILPIFKGRCASCHQSGGAGYEKSGLDLTTYEGLMKGTRFGAMVVPRDPEGSNLMWLLDWRASPEVRMPHGKKKLSTCDRNAIRAWIREGAKDN